MTTLKEARKKNKLKEFIKEHAKDEKGDKIAVEEAIKSMVEKSKPAPKTSSPDGCGD